MRARRPSPRLVAAVVLAAALAAGRDAAAQSCDANHTIRWPDANPVWQLCWVAPPNSSGIDGAGLEIHSVYYNGKLVLGRGNIPIVNVKYDPGGCGGTDLSYRDWNAEQAFFEANNVIRPGYAEPTVPPRTACDTPGSDVGTFKGVAAQKLPDRLILTTQVMAGWYRYVYTWTFFLDGTFQPGVRFTAVTNTCTPLAHYHNIYWRLDFDLESSANDAIDEYNSGTWSALATEAQRLHSPATGRKWRVRDKVTGGGYELIPGLDADVANPWSVADAWSLLYHSAEQDDGGATGGLDGDRAHLDKYVNGENIDGNDVVLWYRAGYRHDGPADCEIGGPTLRPMVAGSDPPTLSIGDVTVNEGNSGTSYAAFNVSLSPPSSSTVSVNYATANGSATAGSDYAAAAGLLTFPPGTTSQTVSVAITGDTAVESAETFFVNLSSASNAGIADGQGQGTILNDDTPGGIAVYDSALKAPKCAALGSACDSGPSLLNGRDGKGPEPNQPNSINSACRDGIEGTYHYDESLDRLRVSTVDGSSFAPGKTVRVEATVWAWSTPSLDKLELYYAANASNPSWSLIATLTPPVGGAQTLSANYTLPSGALQAVRGRFRFQNTAGACGTGDFDDHDDLIFAVEAPPPDSQNPTTAITAPQPGVSVSGTFTITASASDNVGVTRVEFYIDGVLRGTDTTAPYSYAWNTTTFSNASHGIFSRAYDAANNMGTSATVNVNVNNQTLPDTPTTAITAPQTGASVSATFTITASASDNVGVTRVEFYIDGILRSTDATAPYNYAWNTTTFSNGSHGIVSRAYDAANNVGTSATVTVTVNNQTAVFDSVLRVPKCGVETGQCDSGPVLLNGRDGKGPEQNQPNTINRSCADGIEGTYHYDESNDRISVFTTDGLPFAAGKSVRVQATVWAWSTPSLDKLELYYAANANSPSWTLFATLTPAAGGVQTLSATYVLPSGTLQAVRARFRFQNTAGACGTGDFDDHDDLVFTVR